MSAMVYIYTLSDPRTGEVRYVGKTTQPRTRYYNHLHSDRGNNHKWVWIKSLKAEKLKPLMEILESVPVEIGIEAERFWIESFRFYGCRLTNSDFASIGSLPSDAIRRANATRAASGGNIKSPESISKTIATRRANGSQQGEKHPHSKLTNDQVKEIRALAGTVKNTELSLRFGVCPSVIGKIISRKAWVNVS